MKLLLSRKGIELTSLTAINFRVFRRTESCKVLLDCDSADKIHQKFIRRKMRSSFEGIDFFTDEPNSLRNIHIFKKNSATYGEKSILQNLMSSTPLRLS